MHVCMYVCMYLYTYTRARAHTHAHIEGFEFARPGGEYLMKQNKKGKKCAVFCFAGKRKILFVYL